MEAKVYLHIYYAFDQYILSKEDEILYEFSVHIIEFELKYLD